MTLTFDQSVFKKRKDGVEVLSNVLERGETLANGETYEEAKERLRKSGLGVYIAPDTGEAQDGMTLDPTMTSTIGQLDQDAIKEALENPQKIENTTGDADQTLTLDKSQTSSAAASTVEGYTPAKTVQETAPVEENPPADDPQLGMKLERPADDANKRTWFDYAVSKGHTGEYDDITKAQLIEQYGA